ncbi:hypothetical protein Drorol1_Dr00003747 [Drosera rotundifolia]
MGSLHGDGVDVGFEDLMCDAQNQNPFAFQDNEAVNGAIGGEVEIWVDNKGGVVVVDEETTTTTDLLDVTDPSSLFYSDDFPPLPDFSSCMCSSSSSSSSSGPPTRNHVRGSSSGSMSSSSASSAASWAVLRPDGDINPRINDVCRNGQDDHDGKRVMDMETPPSVALSSTDQGLDDGDCMDVMETLGYMDMLENDELLWDPSPLFQDGDDNDVGNNQHQSGQAPLDHQFQCSRINHLPPQSNQQQVMQCDMPGHHDQFIQSRSTIDCDNEISLPSSERVVVSDDIGAVFLEWLRTNKETISADDLRKIRIKKTTIECAARRLGGGKEGMKQLLKLVLQWVQSYHLQNKRMRSSEPATVNMNLTDQYPNCTTEIKPNPEHFITNNLNHNLIDNIPAQFDQSPCFSSPQLWPQLPPYVSDHASMMLLPRFPMFPQKVGYMGAEYPYTNAAPGHPYMPQPSDYHMLESPVSWQHSAAPPHFSLPPPHYNVPVPDQSSIPQMHTFAGYGNQCGAYPFSGGQGDGMMRLGSSATKEARKKRMARQRRFYSHHHHRTHNQQMSHAPGNQMMEMVVDDGCVGGVAPVANHGDWNMYWQAPAAAGGPAMSDQEHMHSVDDDQPVEQVNGYPKQAVVDKKQHQQNNQQQQAWKSEKNLRFLLQKVLKQSDVGNLGRIVLPKKEAETHLPELEARDGITISMEDIATSRVWHMRYRFWPNNKSRMYLLENTGEFVRSNELQEGDFIVIYSDVKCGKYMIRGVKVRPQQGQRSEPSKKLPKTHRTQGN